MPSVRAPARCTRSDGSDWYAKCSHRWPSAALSRFATNRATISSSRARAAALVATYVRNRRRNGSCPDRGGCCWANFPAHNRGRTGLQRSCTNRAAAPAGVSCSFASSAGATPRASHTKSVKGYSALSYSCTVCTRTYTSTRAHAHAHVRHRIGSLPTQRGHTRARLTSIGRSVTCTAGPPRSLSPSLADAESGGNISAICGGGGILSDVLSMARVNPPGVALDQRRTHADSVEMSSFQSHPRRS